MIHTELLLGVLASLLAAGVLALIARSRTQIGMYDKRRRLEFLKEVNEPDFYQRRQRDIWIHIGVALYALGCYMVLSDGFPRVAIMLWRLSAGLAVLWCGIKVMSNASVINEYGAKLRKKQIAEQQRKGLERKRFLEHS